MTDNSLRIPAALRHDVEQIFKLTAPFCAEHLDAEHGELVRKLVAMLARKRPSPLSRGDLGIWAAAAIYAVGSIHFLFDRTQRPHLTGDDLSVSTRVASSMSSSSVSPGPKKHHSPELTGETIRARSLYKRQRRVHAPRYAHRVPRPRHH
jgi:hypothetical protein